MATTYTYRPALDGIRAIAVVSVVVYHLNKAWLPGGYLGVDIFFVMSGYLISTLLILEQRRSGRISLSAFWARRARRLLPALAAMLVFVAVVYTRLVPSLEQIGLRGDLASSLFYVANWRFVVSGQSYFEQFAGASPVRHTWSLAIEEQFYLIWPIVALIAIRQARTRILTVVAATGAVVSIILMITTYDRGNPSPAYYGTGTRLHQLFIGVLLAAALSSSMGDRVKSIGHRLVPISIVIVAACFIWLDDSSWFYYHGGTVLIAAAIVVLIAGLEADHPVKSLLSWRPLVGVGLVSYGIYLWHWPLIRLVSVNRGPTDRFINALIAVAATLILTLASYFLLERPIRQRRGMFGFDITSRRVLVAVPVISIVTLGVVIVSTSKVVVPEWAGGPVTVSAIGQSVDRAGETTFGVVGDSVMVSLITALSDESLGIELIPGAFAGCPIGYEALYDAEGVESPFASDCAATVRVGHAAVVAAKPDVILWHDLQSVFSRRSDIGTLLVPGSAEWTEDLHAEWRQVLDDFLASGADVVLMLPPRRSVDADGACPSSRTPERCVDIQAQDATIRGATRSFWSEVEGLPGVHLIEVDDLLCPTGNPCPQRIDGVQVRIEGWDQTHFTVEGAHWIAPLVVERVLAAAKGS